MTTSSKKVSNKHKIFAAIVGFALLTSLAVSVIGTVATYPTATHKAVARELSAYNDKVFSGEINTGAFETDEYKRINNTPENKYTSNVVIATAILSFIVEVVTIGLVYYYLRRHRVTKRPIAATTLLYSAGLLVSMVAMIFISNAYLGLAAPAGTSVLLSVLFLATFGTLVNYVIVRIIHWHYNRKYSFVEE